MSVAAGGETLSAKKAQVMAVAEAVEIPASSGVEYSSHGSVVVIGGKISVFRRFKSRLPTATPCQHLAVDRATRIEIGGYLGKFCIQYQSTGETKQQLESDIVVDLTAPPLLRQAVVPPGYLRLHGNDSLGDDVASLAGQASELRGTFSKPKYFRYDSALCVHGRAGKQACSRCIDACPAMAIQSLDEQISIDPWLCQGGGICTSVCPGGAITYTVLPAAVLLERMRLLLREHRRLFDIPAKLVLGSTEDLANCVLPDNQYPLVLEEVGAVGPQLLLSALAYGAAGVILVAGTAVPAKVKLLLQNMLSQLGEVLAGLGYPGAVLQLQELPGQSLPAESRMPAIVPATFAGMDDKRRVFFLALDHLFAHAPSPVAITTLLPGAAYGAVEIDPARCTLCMGCTSVCPPHALEAGGNEPLLRFHESKCVQCGLCQQLCPETAISLMPRVINDPVERGKIRVLHQ